MKDPFLGIEIGGTKLLLVVGDASGKIIERRKFFVERAAGGIGIRRTIEQQLAEWRRQFTFAAVGVGFGGPVNWRTDRIARSHQVEGWSDFDLAGWLEPLVGAPVRVDNDANVAALGEAKCGAGRGYQTVFYVTLGSGVGGGLVAGGTIYHGTAPGECEIGHLRLDTSGTIVESKCSGWAVDKQIREMPEHERGGSLWRLTRGMRSGEAAKLAEALADGDAAAERILRETAEPLSFALSHVTHLLHPEVVVIGGGLSGTGEPLRTAVEKLLPQFLMGVFQPGPNIRLAELREDAVPVGALQMAAAVCGARREGL